MSKVHIPVAYLLEQLFQLLLCVTLLLRGLCWDVGGYRELRVRVEEVLRLVTTSAYTPRRIMPLYAPESLMFGPVAVVGPSPRCPTAQPLYFLGLMTKLPDDKRPTPGPRSGRIPHRPELAPALGHEKAHSSGKVKAGALWGKNKDDLTKQLAELKSELGQLRIQKVASSGTKLTKIHDLRKSIARVLTIINAKQRAQLRLFYKNKKYAPLDLRSKQTRAIRRRLSPDEKSRVLDKAKKRNVHFPQRKFAIKSSRGTDPATAAEDTVLAVQTSISEPGVGDDARLRLMRINIGILQAPRARFGVSRINVHACANSDIWMKTTIPGSIAMLYNNRVEWFEGVDWRSTWPLRKCIPAGLPQTLKLMMTGNTAALNGPSDENRGSE
ncbi:hypothetical protein NM208_g13467 [Fusarium decemcellulare]|uniref:Uncharacterized protein n=1 Tax=Fusarium decemcellulare TaxID=57161 RepID=A0ACC1RKX5_9HYPO|nr:hypothetical protein NM208_g13467 [Fusarium decemcellulare]